MRIRDYQPEDWQAIKKLHENSGLPPACLADVSDPLFVLRRVIESEGRIAMAAFVRITSEPFLLVDHAIGKPEDRWALLWALTEDICRKAKERGIDQLTAWIPPDVEKSFGERLIALGFQPSKWKSYTRNL